MAIDLNKINTVKIVLEKEDYKIENSGLNIRMTDNEIILIQYPGIEVHYLKDIWKSVSVNYEKMR